MTNNKQQTAVDSIIEFCQKQMDNDSSIHKGVYLSIIKFCKEQITEESEVHWKTTLITSKPMEMTNNKQQTAVEWFSLLLSIICFLIFAHDIENDRDFWTWLWLLISILWFINYLKILINGGNK